MKKMNKHFRYEDDDLVCIVCGTSVSRMVICAEVAVFLTDPGDEWGFYDCYHWEYNDEKLLCRCGKVMPPETYEWKDADYGEAWGLLISKEAIVNEPPEE